jgi:hypothetical protein
MLEPYADEMPAESTIKSIEKQRLEMLEDISQDEGDIIREAAECGARWDGYFSENNNIGREYLEFLVREQWNPTDKQEFSRTKKPGLTFNMLYDMVRKIMGEQRQNTPSLVVRSKSGKADQKSINLHTDILQSIAYNSRTELVYQQAFAQSMGFGYGVFEVVTDYEDPYSFNQKVIYRAVESPTMCFFDSSAKEPTKFDGNFYGRYYTMSKREYAQRYPNDPNPMSFNIPDYTGLQISRKDTIVVCEFQRKEYFPIKLYRLSSGEDITKDEWNYLVKRYKEKMRNWPSYMPQPGLPEIHAERDSYGYKIKNYRMNASKVLEVCDWPSKYISGVFVDGDSWFIDGKQMTKPFIYHAKDAQKFVNYLGSETASQIKNARREVWMGTPENMEGDDIRRMWMNPETQQGILLAKRDRKGELPQRQPPYEIPQSLLLHRQNSVEDLKRIVGFYDANLGVGGSDASGRAIRASAMQGNASPAIYNDNLGRAIEQGGRIALDLLPTIMDTERDITVRTQDGKDKYLKINKKLPNGDVFNRIDTSDMDIEVNSGPSFAMQKAEAVDLLIKVLQIPPQSPVFPLVIDIIAKNIDLQYTPQLVERLETLVPPQIIAKEKGLPPPPPQPDPQAQMMQQMMAAQEKQLQMQMAEKSQEFAIKQEQNDIKRGELMLKVEELRQEAMNMSQRSQAEQVKSANDFSIQLMKLLADIEKTYAKPSSST